MGRTSFTRAELDAIKSMLREIRSAERFLQKSLRARLRRQFDFYISDFASDQQGFVASDVDALVRRGVITLVRDGAPTATAKHSPEASATAPSRTRARAPSASSDPPTPPRNFSRPELEAAGFIGWRAWTELRASEFADVPSGAGVYVVYRPGVTDPVFRATNPGGRFKGRDPTVAVEILAQEWVRNAHVIYIGKADRLSQRLRQFARFGAGERVGHWGGRYVWQLEDAGGVLVAWHAITWGESAREYERRLIKRFADTHESSRPFANLIG